MPFGQANCRYCGEPIKWAQTVNGKKIPLDPNPNPDGNVELINGIAHVYGGANLFDQRESNTVLHMPHHATCTSPFNPANQR